MKISVYIPDDLWEMYQTFFPDDTPSHIMQDAIRARIKQADPDAVQRYINDYIQKAKARLLEGKD